MNKSGGVIAILAVPILILGVLFSVLLLGGSSAAADCNPRTSAVTVDPDSVPTTAIAGYDHDQLVNAAYIIQAGKTLELSARDQTIGVMTAMGESSLRVLDHGDTAGPDSRGLFQQRSGWGTLADRMDPFTSATNYFKKLATIPDRESLEPTIVANRVQVNADPYYYAQFWDAAVAVVDGLTGVETGLNAGTGSQVCSAGAVSNTGLSAEGWALPASGTISGPFGMRFHPIYHVWRLHAGVDIAAACGTPVYAAQSGTVTFAGFGGGWGSNGTIVIDHGEGLQTAYLHEFQSGILVKEGDKVAAGQQIAKVGQSGDATGCHLHYQVMVDGSPIDPVPFMKQRGITIGG